MDARRRSNLVHLVIALVGTVGGCLLWALFFLLCLSIMGCSSSGGGRKGFEYTQAPQFQRDLGPEHIAALDTTGKRAGLGDAYAAKWAFEMGWCPPTGSAEPFGPYTCDMECLGWPPGSSGCAHATCGRVGPYRAVAHYAGEPRGATIAHEVLHPVIQEEAEDPDDVLNANGGHPTHVTIRGQRYRVKDLLPPGTRWPAAVDWIRASASAVGRAVNWGSDDWSVPYCPGPLPEVE